MMSGREGAALWGALLALAVLGFLGCEAPPAGSGGPAAGSLTERLRTEGDALAARGEYEAAAVKYQAAVNQEPDDLSLRFRLGTALSHLGRRQETVEQFRRVVTRSKAASPEVEAARRWLVAAGELGPTVTVALSGSPRGEAARAEVPGSKGKVRGRMLWPGIDARDRLLHVRVLLSGDDVANREIKLGRRFRLGEGYEFREVPPGRYRLIAQVFETELWNQTVAVEADKETVLDLTTANSLITPATFPGPAQGGK